ncbi:uncharacterized protein UTRI_00314_B [Ustilago trichophora]|uniref:Alpha-ketoglutarate-dependent dioxygenase AlkB-like domain-containing protein n=1 Tax=Ustilago trichophora TaxID=86804 RepID=A0A5C3DRU7_9BASI|nr:uncharacterized protein UTRI_00314_B [Ustilago trichophora]
MLASGPIIWSETRQELCESLPYYRAYQTGSYVTGALGQPPSSSETKRHRRYATLKDSIPYGYLLAGWPSRRDAWAHNGRVIISHGGGKSEVDAEAGPGTAKKASLKQDQSSSDSTIRALLHSSRHRLPIVLIAADSYALLPFKLPCSYAVMGWYLITDGWAEREITDADTGFVRWKFRFEWIPAQGQPWWELPGRHFNQPWNPRLRTETFTQAQRQLAQQMLLKEKTNGLATSSSVSSASSSSSSSSSSASSRLSTPKPMDDDERHRLLFGPVEISVKLVSTVASTPAAETPCNLPNSATCLSCRFPSPVVFDLGWMCLQTQCQRFFLLSSGKRPVEDLLRFSPDFLLPQGTALNDSFPSGQPPFSLVPLSPSPDSMDQAQGLWCRKCGRLSCRELIYKPRCAHCGYRIGQWKPLPTVLPPLMSRSPFDFTSSSDGMGSMLFDPIISPSSGIVMSVRRGNGLAMYSFAFPEMFGDCRVHLIQADVDGGAKELVADHIFADFQKHAWPTDTAAEKDASRKLRLERIEERQPYSESATPVKGISSIKAAEREVGLKEETDQEQSQSATPSTETTNTDTAQQSIRIIPFRRHVLKSHAAGSGRMLTQQFTCNYGVPYKHVVAMGTEPLDSSSPPVILSTLELLHTRTRSILPSSDNFNELYPVLYLEHQKMSFHDDGEPGLGPIVSSLSLGSTCRMKFRLKAKHQPNFSQVKPRDRVVLDLPLRHGSVVVQEGHDLQRYFEHCVNPDGFRIAITARRIDAVVNDRGEKRPRSSSSGDKKRSRRIDAVVKDGGNIEAMPSSSSSSSGSSKGSKKTAPTKPRAKAKATNNPVSLSMLNMVKAAEERFLASKRKTLKKKSNVEENQGSANICPIWGTELLEEEGSSASNDCQATTETLADQASPSKLAESSSNIKSRKMNVKVDECEQSTLPAWFIDEVSSTSCFSPNNDLERVAKSASQTKSHPKPITNPAEAPPRAPTRINGESPQGVKNETERERDAKRRSYLLDRGLG